MCFLMGVDRSYLHLMDGKQAVIADEGNADCRRREC